MVITTVQRRRTAHIQGHYEVPLDHPDLQDREDKMEFLELVVPDCFFYTSNL